MPRTETVLQIFVASPGDLSAERGALDSVVSELNATWERTLGIRLDLWRWETGGYPGISSDPQAVVNGEVPQDYDIFVGLMWARFGTPTTRAGSGTEEEFLAAKVRHERDPSSVHIMFYFKETPLPPRVIDPSQLSKVLAFRKALGEEGVLYWTFDSLDQFCNLARVQLTRVVQSWLAQNRLPSPSTVAAPISIVPSTPNQGNLVSADSVDEESGLLDLLETATDSMSRIQEISSHIAETVSSFGERIEHRTVALKGLVATEPTYLQSVKRISGSAAEDLDDFTARTNFETPLFLEAMHTCMDALSRAATVSLDFRNSEDNLRTTVTTVVAVRASLATTQGQIRAFRDIISMTPRLTTKFNRSKRHAVEALDALLAAFVQCDQACQKTEQAITTLLSSPQ
jgi:hypothetical protein